MLKQVSPGIFNSGWFFLFLLLLVLSCCRLPVTPGSSSVCVEIDVNKLVAGRSLLIHSWIKWHTAEVS